MSDSYPIIELPGSETWERGYHWGSALAKAFPEQDAHELSSACVYNDYGPAATQRIINLVLLEQGENDGARWVWRVTFADGTTWVAEGACDYTGWDCQSSLEWTEEP